MATRRHAVAKDPVALPVALLIAGRCPSHSVCLNAPAVHDSLRSHVLEPLRSSGHSTDAFVCLSEHGEARLR